MARRGGHSPSASMESPAMRLRGIAVSSRAGLLHHRRMARIVFTQQLRRFTEVPQVDAPAAFALNPRLRGYVLDDQAHLRANVVAFIDGRRCHDRVRLDDPLRPDSEVHVMQALSGG